MSNNAAERAVRGIAVGRKIRSMFGAAKIILATADGCGTVEIMRRRSPRQSADATNNWG
jgi:hypothetical protein